MYEEINLSNMVGVSVNNVAKESSETVDTNHNNSISNRDSNVPEDIKTPKRKWTRHIYSSVFLVMLFAASFLIVCSIQKVSVFSNGNTVPTSVNIRRSSSVGKDWPDPPPHENITAMARYVMHISEWGSMSTISTHKGIENYPFVNVFSVSDGPVDNSTGVPYFYLTPMELSVKDLKENSNVSFTVSLAQSDYCEENNFDPEDPRCAHIIFTGSIKKIPKDTQEEDFARTSLFSRHPAMEGWPIGHRWFFAKMEIIHIYVLDYFGGVGIVDPADYFAINPFL